MTTNNQPTKEKQIGLHQNWKLFYIIEHYQKVKDNPHNETKYLQIVYLIQIYLKCEPNPFNSTTNRQPNLKTKNLNKHISKECMQVANMKTCSI